MKITPKLIALCILLVLIPSVVIGALAYNTVNNAVNNGIEERLMAQAKDWQRLVQSYNTEIVNQETTARQTAQDIVTAQAKTTYILIDKALDDNGGTLPTAVKEDLLSRLNLTTVGETGYVYILSYTCDYILSKKRIRDGENIWNATDADGNKFVQGIITEGKTLTGDNIAYYSYFWKNTGENVSREKIAALIHFPTLGWIVGISTYYDDLVDMNYRVNTIKTVKTLMYGQVVGKSGYIWVVNSSGYYQVSKAGKRDGENIWASKDASGVYFLQEAITKAKTAGASNANQQYPWKNTGETTARMKIAGLAYVPEWDWIIGVSAYYDDFPEAQQLATSITIIIIVIIIICAIIAFVVANQIAKPLRQLNVVADKLSKADLNVKVPDIKTKDEIRDLAESLKGVLAAIETLMGEMKKR